MFSTTIAKKLYFAFGILLLSAVVTAILTLYNFNRLVTGNGWTVHTYQVLLQNHALQEAMLNMESGQRGFLLTGQDQFLVPFQEGMKKFDAALGQFRKLTSDNAEQQERLARLEATKNDLLEQIFKPRIELRKAVERGEKTMDDIVKEVRSGGSRERMLIISGIMTDIEREETSLLAQREEEARQLRSFMQVFVISSGLICTLIGIVMMLTLPRSIASRLRFAVQLSEAAATGDFSQRIQVTGRDEISNFLRAFEKMQTRLREMLLQVKHGAGELLTGAAQIGTASEQVAQGARTQSEAASAMAAAVEELTVSINHVAQSALEAHNQSTDAGQVSSEGAEVIGRTVDGIREIAQTVRAASHNVIELGEQAQQISSIVNVIGEIADQTNLLALNAAIEAARAGEQGRGFAVVADEVRKLAERTGASTREIAGMIQKIQSGTQVAVSGMSGGVEQVEVGVELANQAGIAIGRIRSGAERVSTVVSDISQALGEQSSVANDVARNVEKIAHMSEENSRAVDEAARTAQRLRELADSLSGAVVRFKLD